MKFSKQTLGNRNSFRGYNAHSVQVGDNVITYSCLISADHIEPWEVSGVDQLGQLGQLGLSHFEQAFKWQPEIILLGTGARAQFPSTTLIAGIMARGIGFEVMDIGAACRTFNVLIGEDRRAIAALIING